MNEFTESQIQAWERVVSAFKNAAGKYNKGSREVPRKDIELVAEALKNLKTALKNNPELIQQVAEISGQPSLDVNKNPAAYSAVPEALKAKYKDLIKWIDRAYKAATSVSQQTPMQPIPVVEVVDPVKEFIDNLSEKTLTDISIFVDEYAKRSGVIRQLNTALEENFEIVEKLFQDNFNLESVEKMLGWKLPVILDVVKSAPDLQNTFFQACEEGRPVLVAQILALDLDPELYPDMVNDFNGNGLTPLMLAKNVDVAHVLVDNGADLKQVGLVDGMTPFLCACKSGNADLAAFFIQHGASRNEVDAHGKTGLMYASEFNQEDVMMYLFGSRETRSDMVDENGYSPLTYACINKNYELAELLLDYKSKLANSVLPDEVKINVGEVASQGYVHLVNFLMDRKASIYQEDLFDVVQAYDNSRGKEAEYTEIVRVLIKNGAELSKNLEDYIEASTRHTEIDIMLREKRLQDILETGSDYNQILENMTEKEISDFVIKYPQYEDAVSESPVVQQREQEEQVVSPVPQDEQGVQLFNQLILISSDPTVENIFKDKAARGYLETHPELVLDLLLEGNKDLNKALITANLNFPANRKGQMLKYCLERVRPTAGTIEAKAIWDTDQGRSELNRFNLGLDFDRRIMGALILGSSPNARHELKEALGLRVGDVQEYFKLADSRAAASTDVFEEVHHRLELDDEKLVSLYAEELHEQRKDREEVKLSHNALDGILEPGWKESIKERYAFFEEIFSPDKPMPVREKLLEWVDIFNDPKISHKEYTAKLSSENNPILTGLFSMTRAEYDVKQQKIATLHDMTQAPKSEEPKETKTTSRDAYMPRSPGKF